MKTKVFIHQKEGVTLKQDMGRRRMPCTFTYSCPMFQGQYLICTECPAREEKSGGMEGADKMMTHAEALAWWVAQ